MFHYRDSREGDVRVDVAFTDSSLDLQGLGASFPADLASVEAACGVRFARMNQIHGAEILVVEEPSGGPHESVATADGLVTTRPGVGLMVRVADCVPILLADVGTGVVGAVHAGRAGVAADIISTAVTTMRSHGAKNLVAWVGPHVCGSCYEVPEAMRDDVGRVVPQTRATTRAGTPSLDLGAGVLAQLTDHEVEVHFTGGCTMEDSHLHSYRRDAGQSGRVAGLVWLS
ncbi:peptidoglycan editing factor PgeF [Nocardioides salsibiostraticola]